MTTIVSAAPAGTGQGSRFNSIRRARQLLFAGLLSLSPALFGQGVPYTFSTISGVAAKAGSVNGIGGGSNLPLFNHPFSMVMNSAGNLLVTDASNGLIRVVTPGGVVTTFAGNPGLTGGADGASTSTTVSFNSPQGLAIDSAGNLFVTDYNGGTIRKITPAGTVSTVAGTALTTGTTDATGADARFNKPAAIAVDSSGNLYVADSANHTIRKITSAGVVTTYAGKAGTTGNTDGVLVDARFNNPRGLAIDSAGNLYVADTNNNTIRKITAAGSVTTLAGQAGSAGSADGAGTAARFSSPIGLAVDSAGNLIVADQGNHLIRKISVSGVVTTVAGAAGLSGKVDGAASAARFANAIGVVADSSGNIYVADYNNQLIRKISAAGVVSTVAGVAGATGFLDGSGYSLSAALYWNPNGITIAPGSVAYVADTGNSVIRQIAADGTVTTLAGSSTGTGFTDGTGDAARFSSPGAIAADSNGDLYVADTANHLIRKVTPGGAVTTFAGKALVSGAADGSGTNASFSFPSGIAVDLSGNVYVADYDNHTIRKITPAGAVSTLAGSPGAAGSANGSGGTARFNSPRSVAVDSSGTVYVADTGNHTVRKITAAGAVTTLAGTAGSSGTADGTGGAARFDGPAGIAVDSAGVVYVSDSNNSTIRAITPAGVVTTIGGAAGTVGTKDGVGTAARFNHPAGLALDAAGNLYIADNRNQTIRLGLAAGNTSGIGSGAGSGSGGSGSGGSGNSGSGSGSSGGGTSNGTDTGSGTGTGSTPSSAFLLHPTGVISDSASNFYVTDTANNCIKKIATDGTVTVFAGKEGSAGSADGTGTAALFNGPKGLTGDSLGNLYVCDTGNATIRKITSAGVVTTLAGAAGSRGTQDGTGAAALFNTPSGIVFNALNSSLYVTDSVNCTIRKIVADTGVVTTFAGTAKSVGEADGLGSEARFNNPVGIAIDANYGLYVADTYNNTIRKIATRRIVKATAVGTIVDAGNAKVVLTDPGLSGSPISLDVAVAAADDPTAWAAKVATALAANTTIAARYSATSSGAVISLYYLATIDNDQTAANLSLANGTCTGITAAPTSVASDANGTVTTLAGSAGISGVYDGTGAFALFNLPQAIAVDSSLNVYVADTGNNSIRKVTQRGVVTTLAGIAGITGSRDGAGSTALFNQPQGVMAGSNVIAIVDTGNSSIRFVVPGTAVVSTMTLKAPTTTTPDSGSGSGSGGGGGAPSTWFLGALSLLAAGRKLAHLRKKRAAARTV